MLRGRHLARLFRSVDGADEFLRVLERHVLRVDLDHRQQGRERCLRRQQIAQLLLDHVADHALGLRTEDVERVGIDLRIRFRLQREQSNLGPIAVRHDDPMLRDYRCDGVRRPLYVSALNIRCHRLVATQQRVAPQRDDDGAHIRLRVWPPSRP